MNKAEREQLREKLLQYPGATEELVSDQLVMYEERQEFKSHLTNDKGMSNALAEHYLDRKGYPRPPGWRSVFFYPDGMRPRNLVVMFGLIIFVIFTYF